MLVTGSISVASCSKLHRFSKSWGPTSRNKYGTCDELFDCAFLETPYVLGYHHVRLVMNHHRSWGAKGIPLKNLNKAIAVATLPQNQDRAIWRQDWSARIINNELFLSAKHTLLARNVTELICALSARRYMICQHVFFEPANWDSRSEPLKGGIMVCREVPGSCRKCLTDYIVTLEELEKPGKHSRHGKLRLSITTYHQIGDGMSPRGRKWLAYMNWTYDPYLHRNVADYPWGSIRATWNSEQS